MNHLLTALVALTLLSCGPVDSDPEGFDKSVCATIDTSEACIEHHSPDWCAANGHCWSD